MAKINKTKNLFISHYNKDDEHIQKLKTLMKKSGYIFKNSSIDSTKTNRASNSDYIMRLLRMRIHWAGTFVVLIGPRTHTRDWVNYEIEQAHKKGKRIVGIYINGSSKSDIPESLEKYRDALVGWKTDRIIDAIEGRVNDSENPDGTPKLPHWLPNRETC